MRDDIMGFNIDRKKYKVGVSEKEYLSHCTI